MASFRRGALRAIERHRGRVSVEADVSCAADEADSGLTLELRTFLPAVIPRLPSVGEWLVGFGVIGRHWRKLNGGTDGRNPAVAARCISSYCANATRNESDRCLDFG